MSNQKVTQEDVFELNGVGVTRERMSLIRQTVANMHRHVRIARLKQAELQAEYERGYEDGRCEALGLEIK